MAPRPPARKPSFMKILINDFSKKLLIPPQFVRLHRGTLARKCILRPTGAQDSWSVRTKQINSSLYFKKGWKKFAQHYSLEYGDLLIFRYAQDCEFYVEMFDKSCCNKEPVTFQNVGSQKDTTPILAKADRKKKANLTTPAIEAAEEFMASSEFPTFNKIMKSAYTKFGGYMPIKAKFAKMYLKDRTEVKIEVLGKTWTIGLLKRCSYRLSRCWGYLAKEHALKAGDVCVFEFINTEDYTFKLSIFSSTRENRNCQTRAFGKTLEAHSNQALEAQSSQEVEVHSSQALKAQSRHALEAQSSQALKSAFRFSSLSKYPSYPCAMSLSYVRKSYLHVPSTFAEQMNATKGAIKVKLQCRCREWDAVVNTYGTASRMNNGWSIFAKENSLQIGDACVLELINREYGLIRVTIFSCNN